MASSIWLARTNGGANMARRRVFQRAASRRTSWEGSNVALSLTTGVQAQQAIVSETVLETFPNPTVVRIRGEVIVAISAAVGANGANANITLGMKLTTASAFAAGGASVESPNTEIGSDWIWWNAVPMRAASTAAPSNPDGIGLLARVVVDSKAMRKVGPNQVLILVAHNVVGGSTMTVALSGTIRVLLKA